ncbi:hypothetical protein GW889_02410, partial [Candidatus Berkelbacteria bacterium]|nr:hypothetical protein [Candidatus Berkelbacteria bacterium]
VGAVAQLLIDDESCKILGLLVSTGFARDCKFIAFDDITSLDSSGVIIKSSNDIGDINDVVRARSAYKKRINLVGMRVRTESKKNLGKVYDYAVSMTYGLVMQLMVSSMFHNRIIPRSKIVSITKKSIIVEDDSLADALVAPEAA